MTLTCLKAYDIRGKLGSQLNDDIAYRIGRAYAQHLKAKKVVVGGDVRPTSVTLKQALASGLMDGNADVIDHRYDRTSTGRVETVHACKQARNLDLLFYSRSLCSASAGLIELAAMKPRHDPGIASGRTDVAQRQASVRVGWGSHGRLSLRRRINYSPRMKQTVCTLRATGVCS